MGEVIQKLEILYDLLYDLNPTDPEFSRIQNEIEELEIIYDNLRQVMYTESNLYF